MKKRLDKWERTRSKGKWNFALKYGVLFWGLLTAVLFSLFFSISLKDISFFGILPVAIAIFPFAGFFWGVAFWNFMEKTYQKKNND